MGVYIKGMEMPTRCAVCDSCRYPFYDGLCIIVHRVVGIDVARNGRPDFCPLVPVPEHGRLIDADELKTAFPCGESVRTECVRATIDHASTIIPASEDGKS